MEGSNLWAPEKSEEPSREISAEVRGGNQGICTEKLTSDEDSESSRIAAQHRRITGISLNKLNSLTETRGPLGAEASYCDLQQPSPYPNDTLCILVPSCELVVAAGRGQRPESLGVPVEWPLAESLKAQPWGQEIGNGVPYLESLTCTHFRSCSEDSGAFAIIRPDCTPGRHYPDDTSTPDTVDLDAVDWPDKPLGFDELPMMFSRHQERPQADGPRRAPSSVSRSSATDPSPGNQSSRESRAKSRGESSYFCLERNKLDPAQTSQSLQSGLRSTTRNPGPTKPTHHDTHPASSSHRSTQRDTTRASSPHRSTQRDTTRASSPYRSTQRDNTRASSPHRSTQRDTTRASSPHRSTQRDTTRASSPHRSTQRDTTRASSPHRSTQRDTTRASSPHRSTQRDTIQCSATQRDNPRTCSTQRDNPGTSPPARPTPKDNPRGSSSQRDNPRTCSTQRDNPGTSSPARLTSKDNPRGSSTQRDSPGPSSPTRSSQRSNPRTSSPHRTNRDIPWASFPLRPVQSDGARASSPTRSKQSEVPWASFPLRPVQGDNSRTSSPTRSSQISSKTSQRDIPTRGSICHSGPRSSTPPLSSTRTSQVSSLSRSTSLDSPQPSSSVCIGHRDAPRASSPPRFSQHDPFSFFPDPQDDESQSPHHDPPYIPPAVCIGHRDAPRASSPPRHSQHDPFPFLPNTSDTESQSPQHDPPQMPPPVCIGHRDAPRASSPPRQSQQESSLLYQDPPGASSESLAPSTSSMHDPPHIPPPVCIGHRDAPPFSSPPRHAYHDPSLLNQDPPGASSESLAPSMDCLHGHDTLQPTLHVCIGHRDAPRASSPPRHWDPPGVARCSIPPPGPSGCKGSGTGDGRHNLEREEYTMLADLPQPKRLNQKEAMGKQSGNASDRSRSPGRSEVDRIFGNERR
ncbi:TRIO and F-actin-binding protein [Gracilinanus agilis]|uniref:TRIO and F-actin-binding protein n=1 Tax=Gracilinanus agilis TaxID=191870 RepID=UPI001CFD2337|nr:TRIO and F-actin-binding protein [Gracilinanus agilis]